MKVTIMFNSFKQYETTDTALETGTATTTTVASTISTKVITVAPTIAYAKIRGSHPIMVASGQRATSMLGLYLYVYFELFWNFVLFHWYEAIFVDVNECSNAPCINNGTCNDAINGYMCDCISGFTGDDCETSELPFVLIICISILRNLVVNKKSKYKPR